MKDCQEITELYERSKLERLSVRNRLELRFHYSICRSCRKYFKDSTLMDEILAKKFRHLSEFSFTKEEKERLKEILKSKKGE